MRRYFYGWLAGIVLFLIVLITFQPLGMVLLSFFFDIAYQQVPFVVIALVFGILFFFSVRSELRTSPSSLPLKSAAGFTVGAILSVLLFALAWSYWLFPREPLGKSPTSIIFFIYVIALGEALLVSWIVTAIGFVVYWMRNSLVYREGKYYRKK